MEIRDEHRWLQRLVGRWRYAGEMMGQPGEPWASEQGRETTRAIGEAWVQLEWQADGADHIGLLTLGFDPASDRFVGTFISSQDTTLWVYDGHLDESKRVLTLGTTGPGMEPGTTAPYEDIIEFAEDGTRWFRSRMQGPEGWVEFQRMRYERIED